MPEKQAEMLPDCASTITFAHLLAVSSTAAGIFGEMAQTSVENGLLKAR
ncbi:hypothetical protein [Trabulsiella guamensis]|nr:hypothetical protein [Trabulsiella guamensis]